MKDKPNEWVSISDLMAGVVAVVMLLLVVAVLQNKAAEARHKKESELGAIEQQKKLKAMLGRLQRSVAEQHAAGLVSFDLSRNRMTLGESVFASNSACITPETRAMFAQVESQIVAFLTQVDGAQILVEGHTDNHPVSRPVIDQQKYCTVYDDNYTLSAARAREARRLIVGQLNSGSAKNVIVAGYGDSHPIDGIAPDDPRNRRVEVRFVIAEGAVR